MDRERRGRRASHADRGGVGVLMLDTTFPRPPGDVGNAATYDYPVSFETVEGADPVRVVRERDADLLEPFVAAAETLVDGNAVAITTSCGFLLQFQDELAARVPDVPIFTSSLLQIPLVESSLAPNQQIGVLSADENHLVEVDHPLLDDYDDRLVYEGVAESGAFQDVFADQTTPKLDEDAVRGDVVAAAERLVDGAHVGAIICECTNLRPYIPAVKAATGLPVYDFLTLTDMAWRAATGTQ